MITKVRKQNYRERVKKKDGDINALNIDISRKNFS